jgi:hypothetical protein
VGACLTLEPDARATAASLAMNEWSLAAVGTEGKGEEVLRAWIAGGGGGTAAAADAAAARGGDGDDVDDSGSDGFQSAEGEEEDDRD